MSGTPHLAEPALNATPLIDVLLVLLIMLIFTIPIATHTVKLELPNGPGKPPPATVQLEIFYRGEIYWNGQHVASLDELAPRFAAIASQTNPPLLQVIPERMAPYERVAQVLAAAQRAKVVKLGVSSMPD
jgi:biopolymer transport protein ExbD